MSTSRGAAEGSSPTVRAPSRALASAALLQELDSTVFRTRSVVRLLRHAVEIAVDDLWATVRPGEVVGRSTRARQIRLLAALDRQVARETYALWCMLSDAARPHIYELAASPEELRSLQARAARAVDALAALRDIRTVPASDASCK